MPTPSPVTSQAAAAPLPGCNSSDSGSPTLGAVAYLKLPDVLRVFPVSPSTWYALIRAGVAPAAVKLGCGSFWRAEDVRAFLTRDPADISHALRALRKARQSGGAV